MSKKKRVLIIVDVQNDFLPPHGALAVKEGTTIIPLINFLQEKFDFVVATKDWHPVHHCSFAQEHHKKVGESIEIQGRKQELWPIHCVQGTVGAEFSPLLKTEKLEKVFYKGIDPEIDSYSAFFDNSHLRSTGLGEYLKLKKAEDIYIVGLATDYCVKASVRDAIELGFHVTVIIDACKGIDLHPGDIEKALEEMREWGASIRTSQDLFLYST